MSEQLHHRHSRFIKKQFPITLVCDNVNAPANIGSIFRIADSFGIEHIFFCGENITVISKRMQRTARSTDTIVSYQQSESCIHVIKELIANQYTILALEITDESIPISEYVYPKEKIALVIGEENHGISQEVLEQSKQQIHIDMYGNNSSMSVAAATAIALYEITQQQIRS